MELRNIKRFILTPKALRKHNKHASINITKDRLTVLASIHFMQSYNIKTNQAKIRTYLSSISFDIHWKNLNKHLVFLISCNLLSKPSSNYVLTIEGKYLLQQLEQKIRLERFDK